MYITLANFEQKIVSICKPFNCNIYVHEHKCKYIKCAYMYIQNESTNA